MNRSYAEFSANRLAKQKKDADERLKVDQDYAKAATAILLKSASEGVAAQEVARKKVVELYNQTYVGTPHYRDTEGRDPKPKADKVDNTILQDHLAQIEKESAAEKRFTEYKMQLDDMRHKAGEMGDAEYYANRKDQLANIEDVESQMYDKELAALRAHHNTTKEEEAKTAKAINDIIGKQEAAREKTLYASGASDEEARLRDRAAAIASDDATNKYTSDLQKQLTAIEIATGKRQKSAVAIEAETVALYEQAVANMKLQVSMPITDLHTQADHDAAVTMLADLEKELGLHKQIGAALGEQEAWAAHQKAANQAIADWQRAGTSIADSLSNAFGTGGKAIGQMFKAYSEGMAGQLKAQKDLAAAKKLSDDNPEKAEAINRAHLAGSEAQVKSYGDMAAAAQGFFEQGSKGYQAMTAAADVMRVAEVALSVVKGVNAVLTQGEGDYVTAWPRMAAMAALVAGLGVAISGGGSGGGQSAADVQKAQGSGSVFGDANAKSESIAHSIAIATANSSIELTHTAGMLASLKAIEASMTGLANLVFRSTGVTDGSNFGIQEGRLNIGKPTDAVSSVMTLATQILGGPGIGNKLASLVNNLWGKTTQNIVDSGLSFGGKVSDLQAGRGYNQYASVDTTKSSWFGLSKSTSNNVQTQGLGSDLSQQFGLIFTNLEASLKTSAVGLGMSADQVGSALDHLTISTKKLSLKGLSGEALTSAINSVISNTMDQMAQAALPGLDKFRKVGEGYAETVTRVATDYANVGSIFESMGKSLVTTASTTSSTIGNMVGGVLGKMFDGFVNWMGSTLPKVSTLSIEARERLIELAGGIDKMAGQANFFTSNFLTKAEQLAPVTRYVDTELAKLGYTCITTRDQFKDLVLGLDVTTQKGAEQYTALMGLADAFAKTHAATVDLSKTEQEVADERKGLQDQFDQLALTQQQQLAKTRNALAEVNRPLWDMVQAAQKLAATSSDMAKFRDAAKSFGDGLKTGSLSTLTPEQQYAELRRQYESTKAAALGGDTTAQGNVFSQLTAFLTASQKINGGDSQYSSDYAMGQRDTAQFQQWAAGQVDSAQAQLAAMNTANSTLLAIAQGIDQLPANLSNTPINPANYGGADGMPVLVAQVKAMTATITDLKTELAGLRADQQKQTGGTIASNAHAQEENANAIVSGLGGLLMRVATKVQAERE